MILYVQRVSPKAMLPSVFSVVCIDRGIIRTSFCDETAKERRGIKLSAYPEAFATKKYTDINCSNILNYVKRC